MARAASAWPARHRASACLRTKPSSAESVGAARSYQRGGERKVVHAQREIRDADGDAGAPARVGILAGERRVVEQRLPRHREVTAALGGVGQVVEGERVDRQLLGGLLQHALGGLVVGGEQERAAEEHVGLAAVVLGDGLFERFERLAQVDAVGRGLRRLEPDAPERDVGVAVIRMPFGRAPKQR